MIRKDHTTLVQITISELMKIPHKPGMPKGDWKLRNNNKNEDALLIL